MLHPESLRLDCFVQRRTEEMAKSHLWHRRMCPFSVSRYTEPLVYLRASGPGCSRG